MIHVQIALPYSISTPIRTVDHHPRATLSITLRLPHKLPPTSLGLAM
jgi:hypothetical protein